MSNKLLDHIETIMFIANDQSEIKLSANDISRLQLNNVEILEKDLYIDNIHDLQLRIDATNSRTKSIIDFLYRNLTLLTTQKIRIIYNDNRIHEYPVSTRNNYTTKTDNDESLIIMMINR